MMRRVFQWLALVALLVSPPGFADESADIEEGDASYYADSLDGNTMANGEAYDKDAMTAAHRELPFGTVVEVTYLNTGRSVEVTITDRGPHVDDRIIDVSGAAARKLGMTDDGHGPVTVEVISP